MALFNEILAGRFNRAVQKIMAMKGDAPAPQLSSEIMAVLPLFFGVEARWLEMWDRFTNSVVQPASVGNNSTCAIRNPAGSNIMAVVEKICVLGGATADQPILQLATTNSDLSSITTNNTIRQDFRTGARVGSLIVSHGAGAAVSGAYSMQVGVGVNLSADMILTDDQEMTLSPGDRIAVFSNVANSALIVSFWWRERVLEEQERQLST